MKSAVAYYRVSTQRQGRSGLGLEAQRTAVARFAESRGHHAPRGVHRGRNRQGRRCARSKATACRSAGHSAPGEVSGAGCQARSPLARRGLHCRPDGPTRAIHRGRTRSRCRSLHAASLRGAGREGAPADLGAHHEPPSPRRKTTRMVLRQPAQLCAGGRRRPADCSQRADLICQNVIPIVAAISALRRR